MRNTTALAMTRFLSIPMRILAPRSSQREAGNGFTTVNDTARTVKRDATKSQRNPRNGGYRHEEYLQAVRTANAVRGWRTDQKIGAKTEVVRRGTRHDSVLVTRQTCFGLNGWKRILFRRPRVRFLCAFRQGPRLHRRTFCRRLLSVEIPDDPRHICACLVIWRHAAILFYPEGPSVVGCQRFNQIKVVAL